jgi:hypothetical protein
MKITFPKFGLALALWIGIYACPVCRAQGVYEGARTANVISDRGLSAINHLQASPFRVFRCGNEGIGDSGLSSEPDTAVQLGVTMADFTGDTRPDRATINLARFDSHGAQYFIDVELTEGGHQSLSLSAPPVALFVTARDVTGDGTLDLVVRATSSRSIVAVFVNDGCGRFFNARTTESVPPAKYQLSPTNIQANQSGSTSLAVGQRSYQLTSDRTVERLVFVKQASTPSLHAPFLGIASLLSTSGRAPPSVI